MKDTELTIDIIAVKTTTNTHTNTHTREQGGNTKTFDGRVIRVKADGLQGIIVGFQLRDKRASVKSIYNVEHIANSL